MPGSTEGPHAARSAAPPRSAGASTTLPRLVAVQVAAFLAALFLPFGFDHPSALGLDFGHLLLLAAVETVALVAGLALALAARRWTLCAFQLALPALYIALLAAGVVGG